MYCKLKKMMYSKCLLKIIFLFVFFFLFINYSTSFRARDFLSKLCTMYHILAYLKATRYRTCTLRKSV